MMTYATFNELYNQLHKLYQEGNFSAALELADESIERFPDQRTVLEYWRLMLMARLGDLDGALDSLEEALTHECWFSELILHRSPSLQPLQENPRFAKLILRNQEIAERDQEGQFPFFMLRPQGKCQGGGPPCSLLIGLHTNGGSAASSIDFWKPAATLGWLVAAPQSSQALMKGVYVWDDKQVAEKEIRKDYQSIMDHYDINPWQSVLAGHSLGGEIAIWLITKGVLEINNFLAIGPVGPFIDDLSQWEIHFQENLKTGLRGYIILGELDNSIRFENVTRMVEMFNRVGIETELEIVPGMEHNYEPSYEESILRGLNFLTG
jgi:tetratricopeptide (TPR) repeat protein